MMKKIIFVLMLAFSLFSLNVFGMEAQHDPAALAQVLAWLRQSAAGLHATLNPDAGFLDKL